MERSREITVKGVGSLKIGVDYVVVSLALKERDKNYERGYANFENRVCALRRHGRKTWKAALHKL
jgi:hypothetical protein